MSIEITWFGHACFSISTGKHTLLVDPFLDDNPAAPVKADSVQADFILITHGHFDHIADAVKIAKRTGATVISNFEISQWLTKQGLKNPIGLNLGGGTTLPFGKLKMTIAHHTSTLPDGTYGGNPAGFLLTLDGAKIYIAGDTALFGDMQLYGAGGLDVAILPIGDTYTMGPEDSVEAIKLLRPKRVIPCHFNTWPPIKQDVKAWAELVRSQTKATPETPEPGGKITV
ncbi:MAG TPA: metal-dependent hydrolase [Pirellulales bacterium]|jgi:L-ascorbate metabolism protein UlaG (beta-lactamase superfamily)|nr:metal-dependent hydrolase [Pirellulales bacterium]